MAGFNSRFIQSSQDGVHPQLLRTVQRQRAASWRQPIAAHNEAAFAAVEARVAQFRGPLMLDSGCGTAASSRQLAGRYPEALVVAVDKSAERLGRRHAEPPPDNLLIVRADLVDFWRLARRAGWRLARHFLFYPNPWPKPGQLQRRWQAHPVLPELLALGGVIELRSNWYTYVAEWRLALYEHGWQSLTEAFADLQPPAPVSPFEHKYLASGQHCWRCVSWQSEVAMDWSRYRTLCDRGDVLSRFLLQETLALLQQASRGELSTRVRAQLERAPLPRPPGHRAGPAADFFECDFTLAEARAILEVVASAQQRGERTTGGRHLGGFTEAWQEYVDWLSGVHPRSPLASAY